MNVPLGVLRPPALGWQPPRGSPRFRSRTRRGCRPASRCACGASARRRRAGRRRRASAPSAASAGATGRARRRRRPGSMKVQCGAGVVVLVLFELDEHLVRCWRDVRAAPRSPLRRSSRRARMAPKLSGGSAIVSRLSAAARDAAGESPRAATSPSMSDRTARGNRCSFAASARWPSTARYRRASAGRRVKPAHEIGLQASRGEQRRLHGERLELLARARVGVDEDLRAVGPRRLAGLAGRHLEIAAGERRRQQVESCRRRSLLTAPLRPSGRPRRPRRAGAAARAGTCARRGGARREADSPGRQSRESRAARGSPSRAGGAGRDAGSVAAGAQRELEVPHRREDRSVQRGQVEGFVAFRARQIRLVTRDHEQGHSGQVLDQPLEGRHQPTEFTVARERPSDELPTGPRQVRVAVVIGDSCPQLRIGDDDPPPGLPIGSVGRVQSDAEAVADLREVDRRIEVQRLARRPGRGQELVDVDRHSVGSSRGVAQPVIPRRAQISITSSKIDAGTLKGSGADTSSRWAAMSSAVGVLPDSASHPSPSPTNTRA